MTEPRQSVPPAGDPLAGAGTAGPPAGTPPAGAGAAGAAAAGPSTASPGTATPPTAGNDPLDEEKAKHQSLGELLSEVSHDVSTLMRQEVELAKAEIRDSASKAGKGAGMFGGAAIAGYMVILFLSLALWIGIAGLIESLGWAAVIVAVIWAIIAAILAAVGKKEMKAVKGVPQTTETVKEIPETFK